MGSWYDISHLGSCWMFPPLYIYDRRTLHLLTDKPRRTGYILSRQSSLLEPDISLLPLPLLHVCAPTFCCHCLLPSISYSTSSLTPPLSHISIFDPFDLWRCRLIRALSASSPTQHLSPTGSRLIYKLP